MCIFFELLLEKRLSLNNIFARGESAITSPGTFPPRFARTEKSFDSLSRHKKIPHTGIYCLCRERESNPHELLRTILSRVRLPIPPSRHFKKHTAYFLFRLYSQNQYRDGGLLALLRRKAKQFAFRPSRPY